MSRWWPDICLLAGIALVLLVCAITGFATRYVDRHVNRALDEPFAQPSHVRTIPSSRQESAR